MLTRLCVTVGLCLGSVQGATVFVSPSPVTVTPGQSFDLYVEVNSITDLYAYQFDLAFDPTLLQAISVTEDTFLSNGGPTLFFAGTIDNVNGFVTSTADTLEGLSGVSGSGILADFAFQGIAGGTTSIDFQNVFLLDSTLSGIDATTVSGSVTVTPEPSYTPVLLAIGAFALFYGRRSRRLIPGETGRSELHR